MYKNPEPQPIPVSRARRDLFALFDRAVDNEGTKVLLQRRGRTRQAALVSAAYLARLELAARAPGAERRKQRRTKPLFPMAGSMTVVGDVETVVKETRAEQAKLTRKKLDHLWRRAAELPE